MSKNDINVLENLETLGVSLVKRGANRKNFSISKSEGTMREESIEILKTILEEIPADNESKVDELIVKECMNDVMDLDKARDAVKGALRILSAYKEILPDDVMSMLSSLAGYNMPDRMEKNPKGEDYMEKKEEKQESQESKAEDVKKGDLDLSSVPEDLRAQIEQLWKSNNEAVKKAEFLESVLKEEKDKRVTKEFVQKAEKEYSHVPVEFEKLGNILKSIHGYDAELGKSVEEILKSADEVIAKGSLLKEIGTSHSGTSGSVSDEIATLAKSMVQKSSGELSYAEAYDKVLKTNPELYSKYLNDNPRQVQ